MNLAPATAEGFITEYFSIPRCAEIIVNCALTYYELQCLYDPMPAVIVIDRACSHIVNQAKDEVWHTSGVNTFNWVLLRSVAEDVLEGNTKRPSTGNVRDYVIRNYIDRLEERLEELED